MKGLKIFFSLSGVTLVIGGFIFKILHWPFGTIMLVSGLVLYFISYVLSYFKDEDNDQSNSQILDDIN